MIKSRIYKRRGAGKQEGFTLIEVVVALGLLTVGILGMVHVIFQSDRLMENIHRLSLAIFAAEEKANEVTMGLDWETGYRISIPEFHNKEFDVKGLSFYNAPGTTPKKVGTIIIDDSITAIYTINVSLEWNVVNSTEESDNYTLQYIVYRRSF